MDILSKILTFTIFVIPIISATGSFGYEHIKVLVFIVLVSIAAFLSKQTTFQLTVISKISTIFIGILLITAILGINPEISIFGTQPYFQGFLLYLYLLLFSWLIFISRLKLKQIAYALAASSFIVSFLAIKDWVALNFFHINIPTYAGRVVSTFGQSNFYAGFLLMALPFIYYLFKRADQKFSYLWLICGFVSTIAVFISYSRSAILLVLMLLVLALADQLKIKFKFGIIIFGVLLILGGSLFIASRYSSGLVEKEIIKPVSVKYPDLSKDPVEKRVYIWPQVLTIGQQRLLTGYGLENISQAFSDYFTANKHTLFEENVNINPILLSLKDLNLDRTHNYLLDLFLFSGIPGLLAWIMLVILLIKKARHDQTLLIGLLTYLIWVQLQNQSIVHLMYFWLLAGLIDSD